MKLIKSMLFALVVIFSAIIIMLILATIYALLMSDHLFYGFGMIIIIAFIIITIFEYKS